MAFDRLLVAVLRLDIQIAIGHKPSSPISGELKPTCTALMSVHYLDDGMHNNVWHEVSNFT